MNCRQASFFSAHLTFPSACRCTARVVQRTQRRSRTPSWPPALKRAGALHRKRQIHTLQPLPTLAGASPLGAMEQPGKFTTPWCWPPKVMSDRTSSPVCLHPTSGTCISVQARMLLLDRCLASERGLCASARVSNPADRALATQLVTTAAAMLARSRVPSRAGARTRSAVQRRARTGRPG